MSTPPEVPVSPISPVGQAYETEVALVDRTVTAVLPCRALMWELSAPADARELAASTVQGGKIAFNRGGSIPGKSIGISVQEAANPKFVGPLFRSGPLTLLPTSASRDAAGLVEIGILDALSTSGAILTAGLPKVPFVVPGSAPPITVTSLAVSLGPDAAALTVALGYLWGVTNFQFTYTLPFRLTPSFNMHNVSEVCVVEPTGPGSLAAPQTGSLIGLALDRFLTEHSIRAVVVTTLQGALNTLLRTTVADQLGLEALPAEVIVSMRRIVLAPSGTTLFPALGAYGGLMNRIPFPI